jgi:hypothetical protein
MVDLVSRVCGRNVKCPARKGFRSLDATPFPRYLAFDNQLRVDKMRERSVR